jgi:hypothetical protein
MENSETVKIRNFSFHIDNGGLFLKENGKDIDRFDPDECVKLFEFLTLHQAKFYAVRKLQEIPRES